MQVRLAALTTHQNPARRTIYPRPSRAKAMAQQALTPFWPIHSCRSDGKPHVTVKGIKVSNGPDAKQLDRTPNDQGQCDYFREIDRDEPKHMDWRRKLGGMLLREIGGAKYAGHVNNAILWDLPEGYQLYEHIKSKADGQVRAVKNHSGGGHDRQDAYLYGYPRGPKKRFRSPADFFPHLLWLSTDEAGDYDNCTCKLCSPYQPEDDRPAVKQEVKPAIKQEVKHEFAANSPSLRGGPSPAATPPRPVTRNPIVQIPVRSSAQAPAQSAPKPAPQNQNAPRINPPPVKQSTPLPLPRSIDQQIDSQYDKFLSRAGEVVWFFRTKTRAWGLGLILRRWIPTDQSSKVAYNIQPLSYPGNALDPEIVTTHNDLRPWLAWSAPGYTYPYLQQHPNLTYEQVDWAGLRAGRYGASPDSVCEVDASILAAKGIDTTFTLSEPLRTVTNNLGQEERYWNCIFFGAEKIWNGEPVRLRTGSGSDIMVLTAIVERTVPIQNPTQNPTTTTTSSAPQAQQTHAQTIIEAIGPIYSYATLPAPNPSSPPPPPQPPNLPLRMREDMRWRNAILLPHAKQLAYWNLISSSTRLAFEEVKGRWYETSIVFAQPFDEAVRKGEGGNGIWMNGRGDATVENGGRVGLGRRVGDRVEAFGESVPGGCVLGEGVEAPREQVQTQTNPQLQGPLVQGSTASSATAGAGIAAGAGAGGGLQTGGVSLNPHSQHHVQGLVAGVNDLGVQDGADGFVIDDFMNLDGMDEAPGLPFGDQFGGGGFHFG